MAKKGKWATRSNKQLTVLSLKISVLSIVVAILTIVATLSTVFIDHYLESLKQNEGITPIGGQFENQPIVIDNKYGYISYNNLNRRDMFDAYLKENSYNSSCISSGEFDQCAINLVATNKGDNEIFITGLSCKINNIKQINEPLLLADGGVVLLNPTKGCEIRGVVGNHGWAVADDVVITLSDRDNQLKKFLYDYPCSYYLGTLECGESIVKTFLSNEMFVQNNIPEKEICISPIGVLSYSDCSESYHNIDIQMDDFLLAPDGIASTKEPSGGETFREFGVYIDANKNLIDFRKSTHVILAPGESIDLPVKLFANRSCSFDVEIEVTVNYSDTSILGKFSGVELFVSSINGPTLEDGELLEEYSLDSEDVVYFPYRK